MVPSLVPDRVKIYCTGPDCLRTRWAHLDPVDPRVVLCDYCGRPFLLRLATERGSAREVRSRFSTTRQVRLGLDEPTHE